MDFETHFSWVAVGGEGGQCEVHWWWRGTRWCERKLLAVEVRLDGARRRWAGLEEIWQGERSLSLGLERGRGKEETREKTGAWVFNPGLSFWDLQNDLTVNLNIDLRMCRY